MANPKIFVFAPADESGENHPRLESYGCELVLGEANWHTPEGNNEDEMISMARDAHALMGTSIRSSSHNAQHIGGELGPPYCRQMYGRD